MGHMNGTQTGGGRKNGSTAYEDHILDSKDVCSNCFEIIRVDRVDPVRGGMTRELDSHLERDRRRTSVEYAPHEIPSRSKGVFCNCGCEGAHERLWDPTDVDREQFRTLLKSALQTLEHKDVTLRRKETAMYALSHFDDHGDVDKALSAALEAGIVAAVASRGERPTAD